MLDLTQHKICITGGAGFLGRYVIEELKARGVADEQLFVPRRKDFDLTVETDVARLYDEVKPDVVMHLAAEVGGIGANREHPGRFFYANMAMGLHLVEYARRHNITKFLHTGTVCAYPKFAPVPFKESDLWNGFPEETNAPYGVAKKAVFVMLDGYKREYGLNSSVVLPVNLYGPHDNFDLHSSHVIPALIRKCETARVNGDDEIICWGTGSASREFLYVEDAARGIVEATIKIDTPTPMNLGTGNEITIKHLVELIAKLVGFEGKIQWDATKPDGQPRRQLDTSLANELLGWQAQVSFEDGLQKTIQWWRENG
ncbi:MAG: GDP-fucose synthetase [Phycisphaeraceae bacterium]|nr:GDP-fucose synthetase [Phycisphaeraceae bacterium]